MVDYVEFLNDGLAKDDGREDADGLMYASVRELVAEHGDDGVFAAWSYACEGASVAEAVRVTMHRFKGLYEDVGGVRA